MHSGTTSTEWLEIYAKTSTNSQKVRTGTSSTISPLDTPLINVVNKKWANLISESSCTLLIALYFIKNLFIYLHMNVLVSVSPDDLSWLGFIAFPSGNVKLFYISISCRRKLLNQYFYTYIHTWNTYSFSNDLYWLSYYWPGFNY